MGEECDDGEGFKAAVEYDDDGGADEDDYEGGGNGARLVRRGGFECDDNKGLQRADGGEGRVATTTQRSATEIKFLLQKKWMAAKSVSLHDGYSVRQQQRQRQQCWWTFLCACRSRLPRGW